MPTRTLGRTLFVALAVLGLALAAPAVGAHGDAPATDEAPTTGTNATEQGGWMLGELTDRLGPDAAEWMASHAGMSGDRLGPWAHAAHGGDLAPEDQHTSAAHSDHHSDQAHGDHYRNSAHQGNHSDQAHGDHYRNAPHADHGSTGTHQQGHGC
jgi:hypothetical protein